MPFSFVDGHQHFGETCNHHRISRLHCLENKRSCFLRNNVTNYKSAKLRSKVRMNRPSERTPWRRNVERTRTRWKFRDH